MESWMFPFAKSFGVHLNVASRLLVLKPVHIAESVSHDLFLKEPTDV